MITALKPGKTYLAAVAEGAGDVIIPIEVKTAVKLGDANCDGSEDITDATTIQLKLASIPTPEFDETAADVDGDGEVTILDATFIQRFLAGLSCPEGIGEPIG